MGFVRADGYDGGMDEPQKLVPEQSNQSIALIAYRAIAWAALGLLFVLSLASRPHAAEPPARPNTASPADSAHAKSQTRIIVSKETTYVLGPLREDGLPDFNDALNELAGKGVTAENNAAILFWRAIGPEAMGEHREKTVKILGMSPLPVDGDYLVSLSDFAWRHDNGRKPAPRSGFAAPLQTQLDSEQHKAFDHPWTKKEFPLLAEWLDANQKALKLIDDGSRRPRFFSPEFPFPLKKLENILTTRPSPNLKSCLSDVVTALSVRAMLRVAGGDVDGALDDALTCHRLARLLGRASTFNDIMIAMSLDGYASSVENRIAEYGKVSSAQNARLQRELERLTPLSIREAAGSGDRIFWLGAICEMKGDPRNKIVDTLAPFPELMLRSTFSDVKSLSQLAVNPDVDWNVVLRRTNAYFGLLSMAFAEPTYREQRASLSKIEKWVASLPGLAGAKEETPGNPSNVDHSEAVADSLVKNLNSAMQNIPEKEARHETWLAAGRTCMDLAAYRSDHDGNYPAKLAELVPTYLASVPADPYENDQPIHYRRESKGFLIYSVGPNGKDDEGRECLSTPEGDDIPIRVPHEPVTK